MLSSTLNTALCHGAARHPPRPSWRFLEFIVRAGTWRRSQEYYSGQLGRARCIRSRHEAAVLPAFTPPSCTWSARRRTLAQGLAPSLSGGDYVPSRCSWSRAGRSLLVRCSRYNASSFPLLSYFVHYCCAVLSTLCDAGANSMNVITNETFKAAGFATVPGSCCLCGSAVRPRGVMLISKTLDARSASAR